MHNISMTFVYQVLINYDSGNCVQLTIQEDVCLTTVIIILECLGLLFYNFINLDVIFAIKTTIVNSLTLRI